MGAWSSEELTIQAGAYSQGVIHTDVMVKVMEKGDITKGGITKRQKIMTV